MNLKRLNQLINREDEYTKALKDISDYNEGKTRYRPCYNLDCDDERCRCYDSNGNLDPQLEMELRDESRLEILKMI